MKNKIVKKTFLSEIEKFLTVKIIVDNKAKILTESL